MMDFFAIDPQKCNKDGICVRVCPTRVIRMDSSNEVPIPSEDFEDNCLACGHCVSVCPTAAFSLDWLNPEECPSIVDELVLIPDQIEQFLRTRRSIREYKDKSVERHKLKKLLEIACYAPSAKNTQPWNWTVVGDPKEVRRLAGMVIDWMRAVIKDSPRIAKNRGFIRVVATWDAGVERICRGAPHIIVVHADKKYGFGAEDCALALSYLELFAPALGLGTCWGGYLYSAVNSYPPLFEALDLPDDHRAYGAVMVGYPKFKYRRMPLRYPPRINWLE
jgi:nitroreductase/NAD-dependent dihydropyrimidine dehydrogenase PreA subunit